jgi:DNA replication protein DnaC
MSPFDAKAKGEMMASSIHNNIKAEYERRRKKSSDELLARREEVYGKIPAVEDIEGRIHLAGVRYNKMLLLGTMPSERVSMELDAEIAALAGKRAGLLEANGYPKDFLSPSYACSKCRDTGLITLKEGTDDICSCYRQQLVEIIYSQSGMKLAAVEGFKNFDLSCYPDIVDEGIYGIKKSPGRQIAGVLESCRRFVGNFGSANEKNMLFCGPTGVGKTWMAACIAAELMARGVTVLYQSAPSLYNTIYEYRYKASREDAYESTVYKNILEVELLIIDDLGTESPTAARYAELLTILDTRSANDGKKPCKIIISTNIDLKKLFEYYDERIVSRIIGGFDIYRFVGDDIRKLKSSST